MLLPRKKQIAVSHSFGERVESVTDLHAAIASFAVRGAEKLRHENQAALQRSVFIRTSSFRTNEALYSNSANVHFQRPTQDTRDLLGAAHRMIESLYKAGYLYAKAGIMLSDFYEPGVFPCALFDTQQPKPNSKALMDVLDNINRQKSGSLFFAPQKSSNHWAMKREHLSPAYTTRWDELPLVK